MLTVLYAEINLFALVVSCLLFWNLKHNFDSCLPEQRLFLALISFNGVMLVLDTAMWLMDGRPGLLVRLAFLFVTALYYALGPVICMIWSFYANCLVYGSQRHLRRLLAPLLIPAAVNAVLSFFSIFTGWLFYIDPANVYHRGPLFWLMAGISYFYLVYTFIFVVLMQGKIQKQNFLPILLFAVPPFVGGIVQILFYGVSLLWVCVTISILIVFLNIQNDRLCTDHLTGLFNRRQLDVFLFQTQADAGERLLAGLMIDLDSFKAINDGYGHDAGDQALRHTAAILKKTFRKNDFIFRYGGDEFVVMMEVREHADMTRAVHRLRENVRLFNERKAVPYTLSLSIGYDLFTPMPGYTIHNFLKHLDDLMYLDKQSRDNG